MTDDVPIPVRVVFRRWRDGAGVIALFPELPADMHGLCCDSYEHVGQHGGPTTTASSGTPTRPPPMSLSPSPPN